MLAFAGCILTYIEDEEEIKMSKRIHTVSQGICGTERPRFRILDGCGLHTAAEDEDRLPTGFNALPSHQKRRPVLGLRFHRPPAFPNSFSL